MSEECNCDWCLGYSSSDDLSLAAKEVRIVEERRRRESNISDDDRVRVGRILRDLGIVR